MTDNANKTKRELEAENEELQAQHTSLLERVSRMEAYIQGREGQAAAPDPNPVILLDPFDLAVNPHQFKKHPEGKRLGWKNPNLRNTTRGWRGWVPVTYDDEIGQSLSEYLEDPPAKLAGIAQQDNYVRRGTDSILCWLDVEIWASRQMQRERKALGKQQVASAKGNRLIRPGVSTFGDGMETESVPAGGFKGGANDPPRDPNVPFHRTEMFKE